MRTYCFVNQLLHVGSAVNEFTTVGRMLLSLMITCLEFSDNLVTGRSSTTGLDIITKLINLTDN